MDQNQFTVNQPQQLTEAQVYENANQMMQSTINAILFDYNNPELNLCYGLVKDLAVKQQFDEFNYTLLIIITMQVLEKYTKNDGLKKKQMAMQILARLTDELPIKDNLKTLIKFSMSSVIDGLVSATKGELAVNIKKGCKKLFACCGK